MRIRPIKRYCDSTAWKHSKWIHRCCDSWKLLLASLFYRSIEKRSVTPQYFNSVKLVSIFRKKQIKRPPCQKSACQCKLVRAPVCSYDSLLYGVAGEHDVNVLYLLSNLRSGWFWFFDVFTFLLYTSRKISLKWWALIAQRLYLEHLWNTSYDCDSLD